MRSNDTKYNNTFVNIIRDNIQFLQTWYRMTYQTSFDFNIVNFKNVQLFY